VKKTGLMTKDHRMCQSTAGLPQRFQPATDEKAGEHNLEVVEEGEGLETGVPELVGIAEH